MEVSDVGLQTIELFAGAGGGVLGGILLGHRPMCYVERDTHCQQVLRRRIEDGMLPDAPIWDDVRTFDGSPWRGSVDAVCGGFPCQDISIAGGGAGIDGERSGLWGEFARIICQTEPRWVFVENSPMLTSRGLDRVLRDLAALGFDAQWCVLGACDVGAPHRRNRIWILARHPDRFDEGEVGGIQGGSGTESGGGGGEMGYPEDIGRNPGRLPIGEEPEIAVARQRGKDGRRAEVAHTDSERKLQSEGREQAKRRRPRNGSVKTEGLADAVLKRSQGHGSERQLGVGSVPVEAGRSGECTWWREDPSELTQGPAQSRVGRVADGVANRVDRIRALGNGQVPAVAALAWRVLERRFKG